MRILLAAFLLFFASCRSKTAVPDGILPVPKMTEIMWEVMLADELVANRYLNRSDSQRLDTSTLMYQQIVAAHSTTQQEFKRSLQFYEARPDLLQIIIDSLQKRSMLPPAAYKKDSASRKLFKTPTIPRPKLP